MTIANHWILCLAAPALLLLGSAPAHALYKVVGTDGKISYTDRPPVSTDNKVQPMAGGSAVANDVSLPFELRQAVQKYPVVLYVTNDCSPCDTARQLLRTRGIPFAEKVITNTEENETLQRLTGAREVPALSIGDQTLHGVQNSEWMSYLDAAGYPKESRLPANFPLSKATPLTERKAVVPVPAAPRPAPPAPKEPPPSPTGIRF